MTDLEIAGAAVCLPNRRQTARSAGIAERDAVVADAEGYHEVRVGSGNPVEQLAVPAGRQALAQAEATPDDLDLVIYAWNHDQGSGTPMPQARLAQLLGAEHAVALGVQQMSNGGAAALEIAAAMLTANPRYRTALVATADIFDDDPRQRWVEQTSRGLLLGDGGTAAVLRRSRQHPPMLTIRAIASSGASSTEQQVGRPANSLTTPDGPNPYTQNVSVIRERVTQAVVDALHDADLKPDDPDIGLVAFHRLGRTLLRRVYYPALPKGLPEPIAPVRGTGHLGAGDLLANIADIRDQHLLAPGQSALLVSVGMGFNTTAMIVQASA